MWPYHVHHAYLAYCHLGPMKCWPSSCNTFGTSLWWSSHVQAPCLLPRQMAADQAFVCETAHDIHHEGCSSNSPSRFSSGIFVALLDLVWFKQLTYGRLQFYLSIILHYISSILKGRSGCKSSPRTKMSWVQSALLWHVCWDLLEEVIEPSEHF